MGNRPHKASLYILNIFFSLTLCKRNYYSCLIQSFDFRSRLVKSWEIFANWDWLWLCMPAAGNHEETIKPIQSLLHAISLRHRLSYAGSFLFSLEEEAGAGNLNNSDQCNPPCTKNSSYHIHITSCMRKIQLKSQGMFQHLSILSRIHAVLAFHIMNMYSFLG